MTNVPRLVVAGTSSGVGKTTVTVALARALRDRGMRVALFKCGPDYLDPTYHQRAGASPSHTLDGWMMGQRGVLSTFADEARGADVALVEGMMGLFDGAGATSDDGSTAQIARWLDAPVLLVVDAGGMARSVAAVGHGFATFDRGVRVAGLVCNRVGGRGHLDLLRAASEALPVVGGLPLDAEHAFSERHLGLRTAHDPAVPEEHFRHWGALAERWLGIDEVLAIARSAPAMDLPAADPARSHEPICRIGVARDEAFHFYYADNLRRLAAAGAAIAPFSPVRDAALPDVDGLYLGGGYPELFAKELSSNAALRDSVRAFADAGGPVYAECGGLMYLTRAIVTDDRARHPMVGVVPAEAHMRGRLQAIGYVDVETRGDSILGPAGCRFRGHQFRYSELAATKDAAPLDPAYTVTGHAGGEPVADGHRVKNVVASYVHAHWASNPDVPLAFIRACTQWRAARRTVAPPNAF